MQSNTYLTCNKGAVNQKVCKTLNTGLMLSQMLGISVIIISGFH